MRTIDAATPRSTPPARKAHESGPRVAKACPECARHRGERLALRACAAPSLSLRTKLPACLPQPTSAYLDRPRQPRPATCLDQPPTSTCAGHPSNSLDLPRPTSTSLGDLDYPDRPINQPTSQPANQPTFILTHPTRPTSDLDPPRLPSTSLDLHPPINPQTRKRAYTPPNQTSK